MRLLFSFATTITQSMEKLNLELEYFCSAFLTQTHYYVQILKQRLGNVPTINLNMTFLFCFY